MWWHELLINILNAEYNCSLIDSRTNLVNLVWLIPPSLPIQEVSHWNQLVSWLEFHFNKNIHDSGCCTWQLLTVDNSSNMKIRLSQFLDDQDVKVRSIWPLSGHECIWGLVRILSVIAFPIFGGGVCWLLRSRWSDYEWIVRYHSSPMTERIIDYWGKFANEQMG